ncbi:hypothetical protein BKH46_06910 [Helicobacter sp. 12S02634-8]|uniref:hypothetical protein n=1 Tax=Helicobacter sp. 12S02634-8 TaxID=1476199 RepID=UPI000BA66C3E|nr:hypothetical protein [Helicobacter sp. 12S02634-8]PAF46691.1 hypothetical protein BKH46_06910 [Helicobacter sp. 12S02634-8]
MLESIKSLAQLSMLAPKGKEVNGFNATLPLLLKVLAKKGAHEYLLQVGNVAVHTKSQKELFVGQRYWANMSRSTTGAILLSNLSPTPKLLQTLQDSPLKLSFSDIQKLIKKGELKEPYHELLLDKMLHTQSRHEFLTLGNLLLSLQKDVLTFFIHEKHQESLVQIKATKGREQSLEFYGLYPHLGAISGRVYLDKNGVNAQIYVAFERVVRFLEARKKNLRGFESVVILHKEVLEPLFAFEESLLDIKG